MSSKEWKAYLDLGFSSYQNKSTVLSYRNHKGPVLVQRPLYPEGRHICHVAMLHPPGGIAGGDSIRITVKVEPGAHATLTTPGATRWYKANGQASAQRSRLDVAAGSKLDWLPMENIFFDETDAFSETDVRLESGACAIGWDVAQLGRVNQDGNWRSGTAQIRTKITVDDRLFWIEQGKIDAKSNKRNNVAGWAGYPVTATLWCFGPTLPDSETEALTAAMPWNDHMRAALAVLPYQDSQSLYVVKGLAVHLEDLMGILVEAWYFLRERVLGTPGTELRLWRT